MKEYLKMKENIQASIQSGILSNLEEKELLLMFHVFVWNDLPPEGRLLVLQEIENRRAKIDGRPPVEIFIGKDLPSGTEGVHYTDKNGKEIILLNSRYFENGKLSAYTASGALNTVLHEGRHALQHYAVREKCENVPEQMRLEWAAIMNSYVTDPIYVYALQNIEMDARRFARRKVVQVQKFFNSLGVPDPNFDKQIETDIRQETLLIELVRKNMTLEEIDQIEKTVLENFKKMHPQLDVKELRVFDNARFIFNHPEIKDAREILEQLDRLNDEKMGLKDGKHLNRLKEPSLNSLKS